MKKLFLCCPLLLISCNGVQTDPKSTSRAPGLINTALIEPVDNGYGLFRLGSSRALILERLKAYSVKKSTVSDFYEIADFPFGGTATNAIFSFNEAGLERLSIQFFTSNNLNEQIPLFFELHKLFINTWKINNGFPADTTYRDFERGILYAFSKYPPDRHFSFVLQSKPSAKNLNNTTVFVSLCRISTEPDVQYQIDINFQ